MTAASVIEAVDFGRVAVLCGGHSAERDISLRSGAAVVAALRKRGVDAQPLDSRDDGITSVVNADYERACIMLHGRGGEDGSIQGALQTLGVPYTGSGVLGAALSMDKLITKRIWQAHGLPTPPFSAVTEHTSETTLANTLGWPMAIKPAREGSSLGMAKMTHAGQLAQAYARARALDPLVMAERWIEGTEYTASILGDQVLPMIRLETPHLFYDYDAKYQSDTTAYHCPCGLPPEREQQLAELCQSAFRAVGASGWGRVDFMLDGNGAPWLLEVNAVPGMTDHSLVPMAAAAAGLDFGALCWRILETSLQRAEAMAPHA